MSLKIYTASILLLSMCAGIRAEASGPKPKARLRHEQREKPSETRVFGNLEMRPQISTADGSFSSENLAELGVAFSKSTKLSYLQEINSETPKGGGQKAVMGDGSLRAFFGGIWSSDQYKTSFSDQVRLYVPTVTDKRDAGMIFALRNYFIFEVKVTDSFSFEFDEAPILHMYSESGTGTGKKASANPVFENRVILNPNFTIVKDLTLALPLHFYTTKYRTYALDADKSGEWVPYLSWWPELDLKVGGNAYVGVAYRTENLIQSSPEGSIAADGLGQGVVQFVLGLSF